LSPRIAGPLHESPLSSMIPGNRMTRGLEARRLS
jgi:hypothetical protein